MEKTKEKKKGSIPPIEAGIAEKKTRWYLPTSLLKKRRYLPSRLLLKPFLEACTFGRERFIAADTKAVDALKQRLNRNTASSNISFVCLQPPYTSSG